jgi:hypothetical protein
MKKTVKVLKKMKSSHHAHYTYPGLVKWYHVIIDELGWMLIDKDYGFEDKIVVYMSSMKRLKEGIIKKHKEMEDHGTRRDLEIMLRDLEILKRNVEIIMKHENHDFE